MRISATLAIATMTLGICVAAPVFAEGPTDFTATAIKSLPNEPAQIGLIAKSGQKIRFEYVEDGLPLVKILRPTEGVAYILDPATQTYSEIQTAISAPEDIDGRTTPCPAQNTASLTCQRSGADEIVSGIQTERWELGTAGQAPQIILWDASRRQALRHEFPDGSVMQMTFITMEDMDGRAVEHWKTDFSGPDVATLTGDWWYSADLRMVLGEDLPGGEIRRLQDINVGPVDPALFQVPQGWQKQAPVVPSN